MKANSILALGGVCVAVLGAACGGFLALPAEMSAPRPAATVITGHDPNYVAYLKMLASLGPAPPRQARASRPLTPWTEVAARRAQRADDDEWIEVADEAEEAEPPPVVRRRAPPVYPVIYDERPAPEHRWAAPDPGYYAPPAPQYRPEYERAYEREYRRETPERAPAYYPARPWGGDRPGRPARYGGDEAGEPTPPPPPMPSGY